jgi:hypothetical protein
MYLLHAFDGLRLEYLESGTVYSYVDICIRA